MAAFLVLGGAISDVGARCFIRIGTASSVKAAYDSQSAAADFDALLCCVLWVLLKEFINSPFKDSIQ